MRYLLIIHELYASPDIVVGGGVHRHSVTFSDLEALKPVLAKLGPRTNHVELVDFTERCSVQLVENAEVTTHWDTYA